MMREGGRGQLGRMGNVNDGARPCEDQLLDLSAYLRWKVASNLIQQYQLIIGNVLVQECQVSKHL